MDASRPTPSGPRSSIPLPDGLTLEAPAPGIRIAQPRRGYRYSVDAFWLAGFALEHVESGTALDLCTGSGIVAHLLASAGLTTTGIDVQPAWADIWAHSHVERPASLAIADARSFQGAFDLVTCNPPFFPAGRGPVSPDPLRAAAHTELNGTLVALHQAATRLARQWVVFVMPAVRAPELPTPTCSVRIGPLQLCAWGDGPSEHRTLDRTDADAWVRRFRG